MAPNGQLVIPNNVRAVLSMQDGGHFLLHVEDGQIRLEPVQAAIARAQASIRCYISSDVSLVNDLSDERRASADRE
jgi:bifunctional DNA-binding transcriptional regulator/antitoxin component of YhaV-PrlF toxin-antitoxin module